MTDARLVLVSWTDSNVSSGWTLAADAADELDRQDLRCESAGWLVADTPEYVAVAASRSVGRGEDAEVADIMQIPRVAVTSIRDLVSGRVCQCDPADGFA